MKKLPAPSLYRACALLLAALLFPADALRADVTVPASSEKPSFLKRLLKGSEVPAETPPAPPPPAPAPAEAKEVSKHKPATPSSSNAKREKITIKAKGAVTQSNRKASSPGSTQSKPTQPKLNPAQTNARATTANDSSPPGKGSDGEFGNDEENKQATLSQAVPTEAPRPAHQPLPTNSKNAGWEIVKVNGRDYVTAESIHNFYRFSTYKVNGTHVWLESPGRIVLKAQIGSQDMLINSIKFILSFPVLESSGRALFSRLDLCKLIDPVLRPTYISDAEPFDTVVIDAGHGGHDAGARGVYGYEKDFALRMSFSLKEALQKKGFKVILTRSTDTFISLSGRVALANATPRSIFISLHFNSGGSAATGIETFALTPQGSAASLERGGGFNAYGLTGNSHDSANIALATAIHGMVISRFKFIDRGIKRAQWSVLTGCKRPGILFEGGFVTNGNECRLIASETYRRSVAGAIADGVVNYRIALRGSMTQKR